MGGNKNKNVGYSPVGNKWIPGGTKTFAGVVQVPYGTAPGSFFNQLCDFFGSQNDIVGVAKPEAVIPFRKDMLKLFSDSNKNKLLLEECKKRLLDTEDVKWWTQQELEMLKPQAEPQKQTPDEKEIKSEPKKQTPDEKEIKSEPKIKQLLPEQGNNEAVLETTEGSVDYGKSEKCLTFMDSFNQFNKNKEDIVEKVNVEENFNIAPSEYEKQVRAKVEEEVMTKKEEETRRLKEKLTEKENEVLMLEKEMKVMDKEIRNLNSKLMEQKEDDKLDWGQDVEDNEKKEMEKMLDIKEEELKAALTQKSFVNKELEKCRQVLADKTEASNLMSSQLKDITDNAQFLQAELVKQKSEMEKKINQMQASKDKQDGEVKALKEELSQKDEEMQKLKQQLQESANKESLSYEDKLDRILHFVETKQSGAEANKKSSDTGTVESHPDTEGYQSVNIQVRRVRGNNAKVMLVAHPEFCRNIESIPSLRNCIGDLYKSKNLQVLTTDFEGFLMEKLSQAVAAATKKPLFSEVAQGDSKFEVDTLIIVPGSHYEALAFLEAMKGKEAYMLNTKMRFSVDYISTEIVEMLISPHQKVGKIIVVIDPSSDKTYDYSRKFKAELVERINDWKQSVEGGVTTNIWLWDTVEDQIKAGQEMPDRRNCLQVVEGGGSIWLDKNAFTADQTRISKKTMFKMFNKMIDAVASLPAPASTCEKCGIQVESSYGAPCIEGDTGDYRSCEVCLKDTHDAKSCWSLRFQSERVCRHKKCAKKELKHNPTVHDIVSVHHQEKAKKELG